jgi:hypothetical protein
MQLAHQHDAGVGGGPYKLILLRVLLQVLLHICDRNRAGAAITFGAAFLGSREAPVQPQPLKHGLIGWAGSGNLFEAIEKKSDVRAHT